MITFTHTYTQPYVYTHSLLYIHIRMYTHTAFCTYTFTPNTHTYIHTPQVETTTTEAVEVHRHLQPLENLLKKYSAEPLDKLGPMFRPAMHTIYLINRQSAWYRRTGRLQAILEKLGNDVIHAALQYVNGRQIFRCDADTVQERLQTCIQTFGLLRETYAEYKRRCDGTEFEWSLQDDLVFNLPDQFVERCHDMIDLVQVSACFNQLGDVQVGGDIRMARSIDQINSEFYEALKHIQGTGYDLLDISAKKYDDDFFAFRRYRS
jgi:dynein heavy chain